MKSIKKIAKSAKKVSTQSMNTIVGGKNDILIDDIVLRVDIIIEDEVI